MRPATASTFIMLGFISGIAFVYPGLPGREAAVSGPGAIAPPVRSELLMMARSDILACELPLEPPVPDRNDVRQDVPQNREPLQTWPANIYDLSDCMRLKPDFA